MPSRAIMGLVTCAALSAGALVGVATPPALAASDGQLRVVALSTRARNVTGGDVLVGVNGTDDVDALRVLLDGRDITARATPAVLRGRVVALVKGMQPGRHRITVRDGSRRATLTVIDHPISGPVFSGPHLPILCADAGPSGRASSNADCAQATKVEWRYRSRSTGAFVPLAAGETPPAGDVDTATVDGQSVPFVVRYETSTINRSPAFFAVLDPERSGAPFLGENLGWNQRLIYEFGGGCGTAYSQGYQLGTSVLDASLLSSGYAVASATFNTFQTSCNDVISAETLMMVREHVIETLGPPRFTIGWGGSGGAIQQLMITQNYPGLLDAIAPILPFPDAFSIAPGVTDCGLLEHYYASEQGQTWTDAQKIAVNGHRTTGTCKFWVGSFLGNIEPMKGCDPRIPADQIYKPITNTDGLRCTLQDYNRGLFGLDPATGFARRPVDNSGVQYGLEALDDGVIGVDQFLDLNESIGGYDIDGRPVPERMRARRVDVERAHATGRVLSGGGDLRKIPIINVNLYSDAKGDIHDRFRVFTIRERLRAEDGTAAPRQVIWTRPGASDLVQSLSGAAMGPSELVSVLDEWLTTGERPTDAVDNCVDAQGKIVRGDNIYTEPGPCRDLYPSFGDPRTAAGAPLINDRVKCRLEPVEPDNYDVHLTNAQISRLRDVFPDGVCNWSKPGVGQVPLARTWIDYGVPPFRPPGI